MEVYELMAEMSSDPGAAAPRQIPPGGDVPVPVVVLPAAAGVADDLIQFDGTVEDIQTPTTKEIKASHTYIPGGHQFVTEKDSFAYTALVAAGYTLEAVA